MMSDDVYVRLRDYLHGMPGGYPPTRSGVELRILKKLYRPEEAALFCELKTAPETVDEIAARVGGDASELAEKLEDMAMRGLIFRSREGGRALYKAFQFFIGIIDAQINRADRELAEMMLEYFPQLGMTRASSKIRQMRVIPVGRTVEAKTNVQPYNSFREMVTDDDLIAVAPCLCRQMGDATDRGCEHTRETCLSFGEHAQYYIDNGVARRIGKPELFKLLDLGEEEGLVLNTSNVQKLEIVCLCCRCHCGVLNGLKILPQTGFLVNTQYQAKIDPELCSACGTCAERCAIAAIKEGDEAFSVNDQKCVGCGLCAAECPEEAVLLIEKDTADAPFRDMPQMLAKVARERGLDWPEG
jgi:ferredoxin